MILDFPHVHPKHPSVGDVVRDLRSSQPFDMMVTEVDIVGGGVVCDWRVGEHDQSVWFPFAALSVVSRVAR